MFDMKWIRTEPDLFDQKLSLRGITPCAQHLIGLDDARRAHILKLNEAQEKRNISSKAIGQAKAQGDEKKAQKLMAEVAEFKKFVAQGEAKARELDEALESAMAELPNMLADTVPKGENEDDNVEISRVGTPRVFDFTAKQHWELGENLGLIDADAAGRVAGARFVFLKGALARLERVIGQFMLDMQTRVNGYEEIAPPFLVRPEALFGTGQLPKFAQDAFETTDGRWLVPTAEVPLTNYVREQILNENKDLPMRLTALTPCFRSEAGSAGRDTKGLIRQHQFFKVEMVSIVTPEQADEEHQRMLGCAESVLKALELPYRVMALCAGDMGASMRRTFDIEVWLPGQDAYREISSVSWAGDYQARRMNARFRRDDQSVEFVHTLNGSGLAVGRTLVAVMENYQNKDGSITLPEKLRPFMGGLERIG